MSVYTCGNPDRSSGCAKLKCCLFCFVLLVYIHQRVGYAPTAVSRLDLLHSLFVHQTLRIDAYHGNTTDKAVFNGSYFSDKAPGTVVLALVPFAFAAAALSVAGIDLDSNTGWLFSSWMACAGSIGIIAAIGGVALFTWLSKHVSGRSAFVTTLVVFLGATPFPYATMMFSHALVVGLLAIAMWAIEEQRFFVRRTVRPRYQSCASSAEETENGVRFFLRRNRCNLLAGFACGLALASEYTAGLAVVGALAWMVFWSCDPSSSPLGKAAWGRVASFCLAAIPPLLLISAYSWVCFGDPFTLPYSRQASFPAMKEGLYAIKWPDADTAFKLLLSPARGLLFWTPFFAMACFGYWHLVQKSQKLFWLTYLVPLLQVMVISGRVWDWPAGPAWGPRLLSPMIPLLAVPCAFGVQRFPKVGIALGAYSILITTLATLTDACPDFSTHPNPLFDLNVPLFLKGEFSPNLGMVLGLPPYASVALFYAILIGGILCIWRQLPRCTKRGESDQSETARIIAEPSPCD